MSVGGVYWFKPTVIWLVVGFVKMLDVVQESTNSFASGLTEPVLSEFLPLLINIDFKWHLTT